MDFIKGIEFYKKKKFNEMIPGFESGKQMMYDLFMSSVWNLLWLYVTYAK